MTRTNKQTIAAPASPASARPGGQPATGGLLLMASGILLAAHGVMSVTACSSSSQNATPSEPTAQTTGAPTAEANAPATPALPASEPASEPKEPKELLAVGASAPEVTGKDAKGELVRLSQRRGHPAIVYFYPKNDTPGCTKEACAFRDTFDKFSQRGVTIFGVSRDDESSHAAFRQKYSLPFPLVPDPSGSVQRSYGVPDRIPGLASRVTFLVAADGSIAKVWPDVDPAVHADEVLAAISKL